MSFASLGNLGAVAGQNAQWGGGMPTTAISHQDVHPEVQPPEGGIPREVRRLAEGIEALSREIEMLQGKLSDVVVPRPSGSGVSAQQPSGDSSFANGLLEANGRLVGCIGRLREIRLSIDL